MATKSTSMFKRMLDKYKSQFKLNKVNDIAMTMDGKVALHAGEDLYKAIVDGHIEDYPAEMIFNEVPFYSIQRPVEKVRVGDYVFFNRMDDSGKSLGQVTGIDGDTFSILRFNGTEEKRNAAKDKLTGLTTIEVLINPMDCCDLGMGQMNPMSFMLMMDNCSANKEDLFMWMMMSQNGGFQLPGMGNMSPLMMMAMMKDGGSGDMFEKMWMISMMQGNDNPFDFMFQPKETQAPAPTRKTRSDKGTKKTKSVAQEPADQEPAGQGTEEEPAVEQ